MSGLSLSAAPCSDLAPATIQLAARKQQQAVVGGMLGSLRVIELHLVAFILVLSASGLVPLLDLVYPVFATAYVLALSRLAFPVTGSLTGDGGGEGTSREVLQGSPVSRAYVVVGTIVGLFLLLAYVLGGFAHRDQHAVRSATPHLFLLSLQILTENLINGLSLFSPPVHAMVPLLYNARWMFVVADWIYDVWLNKTLRADVGFKDVAWLWFGKVLAVVNLAYFSVNLFGFLIPSFLPRAFERYFREREEVYAKAAEGRQYAFARDAQVPERKPRESKKGY